MRRTVCRTHGILRCRTTAPREVDLVMPGTVDSANDILIWDVLNPRSLVVVDVALEDYALDLVLGLAEPALFEIVKDNFEPSLLTCYETSVCHGNVKRA